MIYTNSRKFTEKKTTDVSLSQNKKQVGIQKEIELKSNTRTRIFIFLSFLSVVVLRRRRRGGKDSQINERDELLPEKGLRMKDVLETCILKMICSLSAFRAMEKEKKRDSQEKNKSEREV